MKFFYVWKNRLGKFLDYPPAILPFLKKRFYLNRIADNYIQYYKDVTFLDYDATMEEILTRNKSIVRFGDGDFDMFLGIGLYFNDWKQVYRKDLAESLERVMLSKHPNLLICFNPEFILKTKEEFVKEGIGEQHHFWTNSKIYLKDYIDKNRVYGSALSFQERFNKNLPYDRLVQHLKTKHLVIVASNIARFENKQLGLSTTYVEGPSSNAWDSYFELKDRVQKAVSSLPKSETLIMTGLGPSSRVMVLDFTEAGYTVWDTGQFFDLALKRIKEEM